MVTDNNGNIKLVYNQISDSALICAWSILELA